MARQKHKPQRTCMVCRQTKSKPELIRVVRTPEQTVMVDPTGKANGRGAYLCRQADCLKKGLNRERLTQTLKIKLLPEEIATLQAALQTELSKV